MQPITTSHQPSTNITSLTSASLTTTHIFIYLLAPLASKCETEFLRVSNNVLNFSSLCPCLLANTKDYPTIHYINCVHQQQTQLSPVAHLFQTCSIRLAAYTVIRIRSNKIFVHNKLHGQVINSSLVLSQSSHPVSDMKSSKN